MLVDALALNNPPRVLLRITGVAAGAVDITVDRTVGEWTRPVQGVVLVGSEAELMDWDVPTGHDVFYSVKVTDIANRVIDSGTAHIETMQVIALGGDQYKVVGDGVTTDASGETATLSGATVVTSADGETATITEAGIVDPPCSRVWLSDPYTQNSAMLVTAMFGTFDTISYPASVALSIPLGGGDPYASVSARQPLGPLRLVVTTEGAETTNLLKMIRNAPVLCVRPSSQTAMAPLLPPVFYAVAGAPQASAWTDGEVDWEIALQPSRGPGRAPVRGYWVYDELEASVASYDALEALAIPDYFHLARGLPPYA